MAITTNFGADSAFGKGIDEDLAAREKDLNEISGKLGVVQTGLGADEAAIIKGTNKEALENTQKYKSEVDRISNEYRASVATRKKEAEDLVTQQKGAAGLEANIAAAAGSEGGRLSVGQLSSINKDITNQFATSINNAMKDNLNFQTSLDDKLSTFGLSIIDKNKILDEFKKSLLDEEAAPLLDALAATATTKIDFIKKLGDAIESIHKDKATAKSGAQARDFRVEGEQKAFDQMDSGNRERYISDKFGNTWSTLSAGQRNELLQKAVSGKISLSEINSIITNLQDKAEQAKLIQQASATGSEEGANKMLLETGIGASGTATFSKGTAPNVFITPVDTNKLNKTNPEPTTPKIGYKIGGATYKDKASYEMLKSNVAKLTALKASDPAAFAKAVEVIKKRYIL